MQKVMKNDSTREEIQNIKIGWGFFERTWIGLQLSPEIVQIAPCEVKWIGSQLLK
jgi:hypothetical protein